MPVKSNIINLSIDQNNFHLFSLSLTTTATTSKRQSKADVAQEVNTHDFGKTNSEINIARFKHTAVFG